MKSIKIDIKGTRQIIAELIIKSTLEKTCEGVIELHLLIPIGNLTKIYFKLFYVRKKQ